MSDAKSLELPRRSRSGRFIAIALTLIVIAALTLTVARNWNDFLDSWRRIGIGAVALALTLGVANGVATWLQWRTVLSGLDVELEVAVSARVFFVSQLGKYVPGSIWPLVLQVEAGRRHGASRKTVIAGNAVVLAVSLTTGLLIAGALLPFSVPSALGRFWWALAALPLLVVTVHPSFLPGSIDFCLRRIGRQPLGVRLSARTTLVAMFWSMVAWVTVGAQTTVLAHAVGAHGIGLFALCTGGTALAISAGILLIPAPAGAGAREVVLAYVLATVLSGSAVLAIVVASRLIQICADLVVAAAAAALRARDRREGST